MTFLLPGLPSAFDRRVVATRKMISEIEKKRHDGEAAKTAPTGREESPPHLGLNPEGES